MSKFYGWLEVNENTPIEVKLVVLDNCVFTAILYGVETWGDISCIEKEMINIETKALKAILKVKSGSESLHINSCNVGNQICKLHTESLKRDQI